METLRNYISVKLLRATQMTRLQYNNYRGWTVPENENPDDAGYMVKYSDGYESWSPEKQFNKACREIYEGHMSFGLAIEALKKGLRVARHGWNGKDMYLQIEPARDYLVSEMLAHIVMKTVQNTFVPWLASQTDMLSDDYFVVK